MTETNGAVEQFDPAAVTATEPLDLDAIYQRWMRTGADCSFQVEECRCEDNPHDNALHDLAMDDVPVLLAEVDRLATDLAAAQHRLATATEYSDRLTATIAARDADLAAEQERVRRVEADAFRAGWDEAYSNFAGALAGKGAVDKPQSQQCLKRRPSHR